MPYVGFHPDLDPGFKRARKGGRRMRGRAIEVIPEESMRWRMAHPSAERRAHGRRLIGHYLHDVPNPAFPELLPVRVVAYGVTTGIPLIVYYRVGWPTTPQPWPHPGPTP
jgi:hypothetical protein